MKPVTAAPAGSIRQARRARVRMLRHRVVAGALALFVASWLLIAIVLVSGHDPALARQTAKASIASTQATPATAATPAAAASTTTAASSTVSTKSTTSTKASTGTSSLTSAQS